MSEGNELKGALYAGGRPEKVPFPVPLNAHAAQLRLHDGKNRVGGGREATRSKDRKKPRNARKLQFAHLLDHSS